jgi:HD-GYP domain-containing protein (c-di-GMP phosphodiesterase class II)
MNEYLVETLEPGKYFSRQVFLDDRYILLSPETPFSEELKNRLNKWGYHHIYSQGQVTENAPQSGGSGGGDAEADAPLVAYDQGLKDNEHLKEARSFYTDLAGFVERVMTTYVTKEELSYREITDKIKGSIDFVKSHRKYVLNFPAMPEESRNYIVEHSTKTTILALAVGMHMKMPPHKLMELGTAGVLHEIGMIRLPSQLYMSNKQLTAQEKKAITAHTVLGFKILKSFQFPMSICLAVLECKENLDGSGYPRGLTGDRLSLYGKILNVTGAFAAMTSVRPFRPARDGHNALLELLQKRGTLYDEQVLRSLVANLSIYPIGSYVQLANGSRGIVVETNDENPRAPQVRVVMNSNAERYIEQPVVRTDDQEYRVVRALNEDEIKKIAAE